MGAVPLLAEEGPSLRTELDFSFLYRYRSSDELVEPYAYKSGIDLARNYFDLPPFLRASFDAGGAEGLAIGFEAEARREFSEDYKDGYFQETNLAVLGRSGNPLAFEKAAITRGALYWRSPGLELALGRDKADYGSELEGSLYPSTRLPYFDAFRARGRIGRFGIDWMVASMDAIESWDGIDVNPNWTENAVAPGIVDDPDSVYNVLEDPAYGFDMDEEPSAIFEVLHRWSWDFGTFRLGFAENCVLVRRNNRFTLTDFLPVISWHQTSVMPNNVTLLVDLAWEPAPGLLVAAQGGFDDINGSLVGVGDSEVPTIGALVAGARYESASASGALEAYLEAGYTHYLWGNFSAHTQGSIDDIAPLARAVYRFRLNSGGALLPLTSPYGPGALWARLEGGWRFASSSCRVGAELLLLGKNAEANLISTPYDTSAKDGDILFFGSLAVPLSWVAGPFELSLAPAALVRDRTWWMEASLGATYRYRSERALRGPRT